MTDAPWVEEKRSLPDGKEENAHLPMLDALAEVAPQAAAKRARRCRSADDGGDTRLGFGIKGHINVVERRSARKTMERCNNTIVIERFVLGHLYDKTCINNTSILILIKLT
jgi:hypothetical protein